MYLERLIVVFGRWVRFFGDIVELLAWLIVNGKLPEVKTKRYL